MFDSPLDIGSLSRAALKALVERLLEETAEQRVEIAGLRDEIARLKGLKGRPKLKPSGMDKQAKARQKAKQGRKQAQRRRGAKSFSIDEDRVIETPHPDGSRHMGYEGVESNAMLLAADVDDKPFWLTVNEDVPLGSPIK